MFTITKKVATVYIPDAYNDWYQQIKLESLLLNTSIKLYRIFLPFLQYAKHTMVSKLPKTIYTAFALIF